MVQPAGGQGPPWETGAPGEAAPGGFTVIPKLGWGTRGNAAGGTPALRD